MASVLGILSHSTFAIVSVALFIMNGEYALHASGALKRRLLEFLSHQLLPLAFLGLWYLFFVKHMVIGGGPVYGKFDVIVQTAVLSLGFPEAYPPWHC